MTTTNPSIGYEPLPIAETNPVSPSGAHATVEPRAPTIPDQFAWITRHPVVSFVALAYGLTWLAELPLLADAHHLVPVPPALLVPALLLGGWLPGLAALLVAAAIGGTAGVRALLGRILIWRVGLR